MLDNLMTGLALMASVESFIAILIGLLAGIIIGAIPGLTADIAIILCLPITYSMEPIPAMLLLLGLYCGGTYGGSITAILINTPGTPSSAATVLDGYPLTQQGKPLKALTMALYASFFGGLFSALVLLFAAPSIAHFTQMFGPPEYFCIAVFGLSIIASISNGNIIKGLLGGLIGIFIALLGQDSVSGTLRFTFGVRRLGAGIPLIVTLVGLFAIAELLSRSDYNPRTDATRKQHLKLDHEKLSWAEIKRCLKTMTISSSKYRDHFGHGEIEGVSATESANNATTGSTLIPLTTLGVPGDGCTAILLGAFMLQGMVPGPSMFKEHSDILYGIMIGLVVINILMLIIGRVFTPLYANITRIPYELMSAIIIVYCITGVYSSEASTFQVLLAVIIGAFSFLLRKLGFGVVPIILGVVLGDLVETNFRNSMVMSGNSLSIFVTRPFSLLFLALAVLSIGMFFYKAAKDRKKQKTELD